MLLVLVITGAITAALWIILNAKYICDGNHGGGTCWSSSFVLGGSMLTTSLYMLVLWLVLWRVGFVVFPMNPLFWSALAVTVIINIFFEILRFKAYGLADIAMVAPFAGIAPILTILTSWLIINETPTVGGAFGIILIAVSIYFLYIRDGLSWSSILAPFKAIWSNRGVRYGFLSSIPPAVSIIFDKKAVMAADPISFALFALFFIGLGAWLFDFFVQGKTNFAKQINGERLKRFLPISLLLFVSNISFTSMFLFDSVPNISALRRLVIVFEVILGFLILKQKTAIKKRLIASVGVVIGCILIGIFR